MPGPLLFLVAILLVFVVVFFVLPLTRLLIQQRTSPLRHLPGPPCPSFFLGNLVEMHDQENTNLVAAWEATYGPTFVYHGFIAAPRLITTDPLAISHILAHAYEYPKPDFVRNTLASMAAGHDGILTVEGDQHRRQRRILGPAFSKLHLASLTPVFWEKALQLRNIWLDLADANGSTPPRIDALSWLGRATLDVIGEAGFGYRFDSLSSSSAHNELAAAFGVIFTTARKFRVATILKCWFPILRRFRRNNAATIRAHETLRRIGTQLIDQTRAEILADSAENNTTPVRDLLSLLIRSNLSTPPAPQKTPSLPPHQTQMSTQEVLCQISTFIAAGHETTASALTWCLYALSRAPHAQAKLRTALRALPRNVEEGVDVAACTYLDWVVREALRLHAPVTSTMRVCARPGGDEIPLSVPVGVRSHAYGGRGGYGTGDAEQRWSVRVAEGDIVSVPIQAVNKCGRLWGEDAGEFRPERWADPPDAARSIPGLLAGTLTFLNGNGSVGEGNRACIGWRFALMEIKIFLYTLVKDMEFWMDEDMIIEKRINVVTRPFVKSEPHLGNQMPLRVRRAPP